MKCSKKEPCKAIIDIAGGQGDRDGILIQRYYPIRRGGPVTDRLVIYRTKARGGPLLAKFCPACGEDISAGWPVDGEGER